MVRRKVENNSLQLLRLAARRFAQRLNSSAVLQAAEIRQAKCACRLRIQKGIFWQNVRR
jgi:hypothetical protein